MVVSASATADGADYGGFTSGTTTSGIQEAINALPASASIGTSYTGGGTIFLSKGTFSITSTISFTKSNVTIIGAGWDTIIKAANSSNLAALIQVGNGSTIMKNVIIEELQLDGNRPNQSSGNGRNIFFNGSGANTINRCVIRHVFIWRAFGTGIYLSSSNDNVIDGCYVEDSGGMGMICTGGGRNHINICTYDTNVTNGLQIYLEAYDTITGCFFESNLQHGLQIFDSTYCAVTGNTFQNSSQQTNNTYYEIQITDDGSTCQYNMITGNTFVENLANKAKYMVREETANTNQNFNYVTANTANGAATSNFSMQGLNSMAINNLTSDTTGGAIFGFKKTFAPSNPASTTSTTQVMMGLGTTVSFTPRLTGRARIYIRCLGTTAAGLTTWSIQPYHGTGTAPANGAATSGTADVTLDVLESAAVGTNSIYTNFYEVTNLTVNTAYWFDLSLSTQAGADAASIIAVQYIIEEGI